MIPLQRPARAVSFSLAWAICLTCFDPAHATVTPFAHFRMGDDTPPTQGGRNLPRDSSGQGRHMTGAGAGTPVIQAQGGPTGDAFYRFNGSTDYFFGTSTPVPARPTSHASRCNQKAMPRRPACCSTSLANRTCAAPPCSKSRPKAHPACRTRSASPPTQHARPCASPP